jgi:hypothetical protein
MERWMSSAVPTSSDDVAWIIGHAPADGERNLRAVLETTAGERDARVVPLLSLRVARKL